jgi:succinate dehydrogenase/fumarate reductase flavoprotein subunit
MMKDAPVKKKHAVGLPGSPAPKPSDAAQAQSHKNAAKPPHPAASSPALMKIRDIMWRLVGILRSGKELTSAIDQLQTLEPEKAETYGRAHCELRNMHALALLMSKSALARHESRGSHYRSDFPYRDDDDFSKHSVVQKGKQIRFEA